jgi:hypothetical protein
MIRTRWIALGRGAEPFCGALNSTVKISRGFHFD